eukprot:341428_1
MTSPLTVVYIPAENEEDVYVEAQLIDSIGNNYNVRLNNGEEMTIAHNLCLPAPVLGPEGEQDMIFLEHLNEGSLLHNLRKRFFAELIYTYTGSILMSVNPYRMLPIYTPSIRRAYAGRGLMECPPHIFAISDVCYRAMLSESIDQSVLISGESGAGKTECCKLLMSYLSFISEQEALGDRDGDRDGVRPNEKVLATNPVLESFGNAKTVRNDNSSRFGKMLDVQFDGTGLMIGASIRQYLLEEIRVVRQGENERNFHCFYYICAGADKTERERFSVTEAKDYYYTNQSQIYELPNVNSKYEYIELKRAMGIAGLRAFEIFSVMNLMSSILWIGNIQFEEYGDNKCRVVNIDVLKWAALLLEVNPAVLTKALITRENIIRSETFIIPLSVDKAITRRDTLAKMLYQKNFVQIVDRLNENIDINRKKDTTLTAKHHCLLLDIFGFEVFESNHFEQFCINFANERLQFEFNEHIFRLEQQVYKSENIDISAFRYNDNKPTIHLIEKKPQGILWLLDEQAKFPQSTDKSFYEKICAVHKKRKNVFKQPRFSTNLIVICHYAGDVEYDTIGFLEKTKKYFGIQMMRMMQNSDQKQYKQLFEEKTDDNNPPKKGGRGKASKKSVGIEFRNALSKLMADLKQTEPHYVRCIKPNELKSYKHFNGVSVLRQLRCSGVLETIRIRSGGYPNRRPFKEFIQRYLVLAPTCNRKGGPRNVLNNMCQMLEIEKSHYKLGITKIFLKDKIFHKLEGQRNHLFTQSATMIQRFYRGYNERMEFWIVKASADLLQYRLRQYLKAADPTETVKAIIKALQFEEQQPKEEEVIENIMKLEKLGIRDKNVDIIADLGGVKEIIAVSKQFKGNQDIEVACTRALNRFSNNEENATKVARSGGVKQMVSNVNKDKEKNNQESIQLIDKLATVNRNVNIVIKEKTVAALTNALRNTSSDDKSHIAAKALGTITKHRKAALRIGRDEKAIETVLNSIRNKPKFGRMVTYSLNCVANLAATNKHNWESIVELGGIESAILALKHHVGNASIIKEVGRLFAELCKNKQYAETIIDSGVLQLALQYLKKNPDGCGVSATKMIDDITRACPEKSKKILLNKIVYDDEDDDDKKENANENGLQIISEALNKLHTRPDIAAALARTINGLCSLKPEFIEGLAHCSAAQYILSALQAHPGLSLVKLHESEPEYIFPIDCVEALMKFAKFDVAFLDSIKQDGAVKAIALTMDGNPELSELIVLGADALRLFSEQDDLRHAMDIIARSRMEADSFEPKLVEQAISIVGNLVLIDVNAQYVVAEGGIAIFLSIIAGKIKPATAHREDAVVLASAIRALGRLLTTLDTVAMWQDEGGIHSFEDIVNNLAHSELVMNAICDAMKTILSTGAEIIKQRSQLLPLLTSKVFKLHSEYTVCIGKYYQLLSNPQSDFLDDTQFVNTLLENGLIEGIKNHLEQNKKNSEQVVLSMQFISTLLAKQPKLTAKLIEICAQTIVNVMKYHKKDAVALHSAYNVLYALIENDPNVILAFKEYGFEEVLTEILDQKDIDEQIYNETNTFLSTMISDDKIISALDSANVLAQQLMDKPNDIGLIEDLDKRLIFLANVCGAENKYKTVIDNGGLILLPTCFQALNEAKDCLAREHAIESAAFAAYKLGEFGNPKDILDDSCYGQMADLYLNNVAYEGLAEYLAKLTVFGAKKAVFVPELHEQRAVEANIAMINNFPLKDDLAALCASNIAKLAIDSETVESIIQCGGVNAMFEALSYMLISEITTESINILQSVQKIVHIDGVTSDMLSIDDNAIQLLIEAIKMREEPKMVQEALQTIFVLCQMDDEEFVARFIAANGLNEIIKNLKHFKTNVNISETAMKVLGKCCAAKHDVVGIIDVIKASINQHPNNEVILSHGVTALALLAAHSKATFLDTLIRPETISIISGAVSARPRDIVITKALATFVTNLIGDTDSNNQIVDQFKQFGLIDVLHSAATIHSDNEEVVTIIQMALDCVNPKAEDILQKMLGNVNNEALVSQLLDDTLQKLLSPEDEPFDAKVLNDAICKIWSVYEVQLSEADSAVEHVAKLIIDIVYEMSESPEYCTPLMECSLVETLIDATMVEDAFKVELLQELQLGVINILNNLAMIEDGREYLNRIRCHESVLNNALNAVVTNKEMYSDTDEQVLLRGLRTIALINADGNYGVLISNGLIHVLQQIALHSDNQLLVKETFCILESITSNISELSDNDSIEPQAIHQFVLNSARKFENNATVSAFCNNIVHNLQPLIVQASVNIAPPPPDMSMNMAPPNMNGMAMPPPPNIGQNVVSVAAVPPAPNVAVMDAQLEFHHALDRRLDDEQKEKALLAFIDIDITENDIAMLMENHAVDKLISSLAASKKVHNQQKLMNALFKVTQAGDENFERFIGAGGVGVLIKMMDEHLSASGNIFVESLHFIGEISSNNHLKTVLGMHNIIQLMIKCIRQNTDNVVVLDSCFYVLANLAYDHHANMTQIIELGGVDDIFGCIKTWNEKETEDQNEKEKCVLLMRSAMDLLSNLMHNSNTNRILICKGCKQILNALSGHGSIDNKLAVSCFRCLGNLAYVPDNISKLVREGIIDVMVETMTRNLKQEQCLQMGAAVLSNIAADQMVSEKMIESGVLKIILHISRAFPDLIELQKSCLGCMGNIANNAQNCYTMIDQGCGKRILEIVDRLYFDEHIIKLSLSLIKILTVSPDISTQFTRDGASEIITRIVKENQRKQYVIRLCSQALCKCIMTLEASEIAGNQSVVTTLCDIAKEGNNCYNAALMIDVMKVFQNMCQIETNAQKIARHSSVPILRGMEHLKTNAIFMNVSATLLGNLAIYSSASKHIVKRGGCAVCIECIKFNVKHQGVLAKLLRCISNLVLTETKSYEIFIKLQCLQIIEQINAMYPNHKQIKKSSEAFLKAMKLKSHKLHQDNTGTKALKDKVDIKYIKFLTSGVVMKKYCSSAKPRKRIIKLTDDLEYIVLMDPNGKKAPKKLYVRNITELRTGACTFTLRRSGFGFKKANNERSFALFSQDQTGKMNDLNLECKTVEIYEKWVHALNQIIEFAHQKSKVNYT